MVRTTGLSRLGDTAGRSVSSRCRNAVQDGTKRADGSQHFQESLAHEHEAHDEDKDQFFGLSLREIVHQYKWQTLVLLKSLLLQQRVSQTITRDSMSDTDRTLTAADLVFWFKLRVCLSSTVLSAVPDTRLGQEAARLCSRRNGYVRTNRQAAGFRTNKRSDELASIHGIALADIWQR